MLIVLGEHRGVMVAHKHSDSNRINAVLKRLRGPGVAKCIKRVALFELLLDGREAAAHGICRPGLSARVSKERARGTGKDQPLRYLEGFLAQIEHARKTLGLCF